MATRTNKAKHKKDDSADGTLGFKTNSADGKKLEKLLLSGTISAGCPPRMVADLHPEFKKYKPDSFRSGLRRMKTNLGINVCPPIGSATGEFRHIWCNSVTVLFHPLLFTRSLTLQHYTMQ